MMPGVFAVVGGWPRGSSAHGANDHGPQGVFDFSDLAFDAKKYTDLAGTNP